MSKSKLDLDFFKKEVFMAPKTVAIIMDGNGRWAKKRGLPRTAGHKKGADTIRTVALAAQDMGIQKLILYAFSTETGKDQKMKFPIYVNYQDYFLINLLMN